MSCQWTRRSDVQHYHYWVQLKDDRDFYFPHVRTELLKVVWSESSFKRRCEHKDTGLFSAERVGQKTAMENISRNTRHTRIFGMCYLSSETLFTLQCKKNSWSKAAGFWAAVVKWQASPRQTWPIWPTLAWSRHQSPCSLLYFPCQTSPLKEKCSR